MVGRITTSAPDDNRSASSPVPTAGGENGPVDDRAAPPGQTMEGLVDGLTVTPLRARAAGGE
jgi:hypothetical protein